MLGGCLEEEIRVPEYKMKLAYGQNTKTHTHKNTTRMCRCRIAEAFSGSLQRWSFLYQAIAYEGYETASTSNAWKECEMNFWKNGLNSASWGDGSWTGLIGLFFSYIDYDYDL